jgi:hypothetical protein
MPHDYLPRPDGRLDAWAESLYTFLDAHAPEVGLDAADAQEVKDAWVAYSEALAASFAAHAAAVGATQLKDELRKTLETVARAKVRTAQAFPGTTDGARGVMAVSIPATPRRAVPAPTSVPVIRVDHSRRLRHTLRFNDSGAVNRAARPAGTLGAELWMSTGGDPPADAADLRYIQTATAGRCTVEFPEAAGGRTAHYWARWVTRSGARGPWGMAVAATVAA